MASSQRKPSAMTSLRNALFLTYLRYNMQLSSYHTFNLAPLSYEPQSKTGNNSAVHPSPLTPISRKKREYLMMSLRPAIPDKDIPQCIPPPSEIAPLVVKFSKDCVPLSCFSSTISCLLSMRLSRAGTDNDSPECLTHNVVSLFDPQLPADCTS